MKIKIIAAALAVAIFSGNGLTAGSSKAFADKELERECRDLAGQVLDAGTPSATKAWFVIALKEALAIGAGYVAFKGVDGSVEGQEWLTPKYAYFIAWGLANMLLSAYVSNGRITDKLDKLETSIKANKLSNSEDEKFWFRVEKDLKSIYKKISAANEVGEINDCLMYIAKCVGQTYAAHKITSKSKWDSWLVTFVIDLCLVWDRFWIKDKETEKKRVLRLLEEVQSVGKQTVCELVQ